MSPANTVIDPTYDLVRTRIRSLQADLGDTLRLIDVIEASAHNGETLRWIDREEYAKKWGISARTVDNLVRQRRLHFHQVFRGALRILDRPPGPAPILPRKQQQERS